jgi:Carboxypeptidase regulatory-like domain/Sodium/hydrogen exchanger family
MFQVLQQWFPLSFLFLLSCPVFAQSTQLRGTVKDPNQAEVAHATVTLSDSDRQTDRTVSTNNQGGYAFTDLAPGTYTLQVVAAGFKTSATQVAVAPGRSATQDISIGGALVGLTIGLVVTWLERWVDDGPVEITLSLIVPYAAYLMSEAVKGSGVIAVVVCGLFISRRSSTFFQPEYDCKRGLSGTRWSFC